MYFLYLRMYVDLHHLLQNPRGIAPCVVPLPDVKHCLNNFIERLSLLKSNFGVHVVSILQEPGSWATCHCHGSYHQLDVLLHDRKGPLLMIIIMAFQDGYNIAFDFFIL